MDGSVFFPIGLGLVVLAVILSAIGIRGKGKFPPSAPVMIGVCALFFAVVACTAALAVVNAEEEKEHRDEEIAHEQAEAEEQAAEEQPAAPPAGGKEAGGASELAVTSPEDGSLAFDPDSLTATAGALTITYSNPSSVEHNIAVEGDAAGVLGETETFAEGEQDLTIDDIPEGQYTFFCTVPGHREGGMEGTLLVE